MTKLHWFNKLCKTAIQNYVYALIVSFIFVLSPIFFQNNIVTLTIGGLLIVYLILSALGLLFYGHDLLKKRELWAYIAGYLYGYVGIIAIFSILFLVTETLGLGHFDYSATLNLKSGMRELYFSSLTFFSTNLGDITPIGWHKLIAVFNAVVGTLYSVIYIGHIFISNAKPTTKKNK